MNDGHKGGFQEPEDEALLRKAWENKALDGMQPDKHEDVRMYWSWFIAGMEDPRRDDVPPPEGPAHRGFVDGRNYLDPEGQFGPPAL